MKITDVTQAPSSPNPHKVNAAVVYDTKDAIVVHITLEAGENLKPHITPVDVFFVVLEGEPEIQVGEEREKISANNLVESPAGIVHCIYNPSAGRARILVVKTPKPVKSTKIL